MEGVAGSISILLMILISLAFVASPFLGDKQEMKSKATTKLDKAKLQKELYYKAIKDIDFEYAEGKLSDKDHDELRSYYKEKAIKVVKEIEVLAAQEKAAAIIKNKKKKS